MGRKQIKKSVCFLWNNHHRQTFKIKPNPLQSGDGKPTDPALNSKTFTNNFRIASRMAGLPAIEYIFERSGISHFLFSILLSPTSEHSTGYPVNFFENNHKL